MLTILIIVVLILTILAFFSTAFGETIIDYFSFFVEGQKYDFLIAELHLLWKVSKKANIKNRTRLFWSVAAVEEAIYFLTKQQTTTIDLTEKEKLTKLLSKLYDFRTKIELESVQKKRGLESTSQIRPGQICVLVFAELGQFYASVIENVRGKIVLRSVGEIPKTFNFDYKGDVSVYLWRKGDAGYIFKTQVLGIEYTNTGTLFTIAPSRNVMRTQKRKSVRAVANFPALLYVQHPETVPNILPETVNGVKCIVKDISEDGAQILVKGRAVNGMRAKLQFELAPTKVVMFVKTIRFVYSNSQNISKVHMSCEKISDESRNAILSYVYRIATPSEDIFADYEEN
ncbi:MAG: PilZ domain-containing protein [Treponemataceae bacterium]